MTDNSDCYLISTQDNVLAVRLCSSWDLATTQRFCLETNQSISLVLPEKWGLIADASHWCLKTEPACELIFDHHKACIRMGLTHQAIILPRSALKRWRIKAFVSSDYSIKTFLAENERDAIHWLHRKGFNFPGFSNDLRVI